MLDEHGFLGVPRENFEEAGRAQMVRLLQHGLVPESKVLDIGCGCLRVAYWLIRFLDPGCYCGIEPARQRVELGRRYLFAPDELEVKRPRFDFNAVFDLSVFQTRFDFFLAGSIWTHCSKSHIETTLDGFLRNSTPTGVFLASYLPPATAVEDYMGNSWVGTSHESDEPGVIRHSLDWIKGACGQRGLVITAIEGEDPDSQYWLRVERR
jgi:SAM-dependent methyltransferase